MNGCRFDGGTRRSGILLFDFYSIFNQGGDLASFKFSRPRFVTGVGLFGGLVMLTACSSNQYIPVHDKDSPSFAMRGAIRPKAWQRNERVAHGIEVGYEGYRAKDTQALAAGQSLDLDGGLFPGGTGTINGPASLNHQFSYRQLHVAYAPLIRFGTNFELEPLAGVARKHVKVETQPAGRASINVVDEWRTSAIAGVTPRWRFNDWLAAEVRWTYTGGTSEKGTSTEVAAVLSPSPNVALRLGYGYRREDIEPYYGKRLVIPA